MQKICRIQFVWNPPRQLSCRIRSIIPSHRAHLAKGSGVFLCSTRIFRYNQRPMFKSLSDSYLTQLKTGGYPIIALLMAMESSIVPIPSEVIIPPAAHLAYTNQANLTIVGIIIAGTLGSWVGATVMYWAARLAG